MSKLLMPFVVASVLSFPATVLAQTNCPSTQAIPPFVGSGSAPFSPNQSLCLPRLAPVPTGVSLLAFIVQGVEPGDRVDAQGTVYVVSIRGVPGGVDLWRWYSGTDGPPNNNHTLPFKYEGQPDNCGIYGFTNGGVCQKFCGSMELCASPPGARARHRRTHP